MGGPAVSAQSLLVCRVTCYSFSCPPRPKTIKRKGSQVSSAWVLHRAPLWVAWYSLSLCCSVPPRWGPSTHIVYSWHPVVDVVTVQGLRSLRQMALLLTCRQKADGSLTLGYAAVHLPSHVRWGVRTVQWGISRRPHVYKFSYSICYSCFIISHFVPLLLWLTGRLNVVVGIFTQETT